MKKAFPMLAVFAAISLATPSASPGQGQQQPPAPNFNLSAPERAALLPVQTAITAKDWEAARTALAAAIPVAKSPGATYAVGRFQVEIGLGLNDRAMQQQGLDALAASGQVPPAQLPEIYRNIGLLANDAGDKAKADRAFAKVVELMPNDPNALISLAQIRNDLRRPSEAVALIRKAIGLKRAAGQQADESWYKYALKLAYDGRAVSSLRAASLELGPELLAAYPTSENLRDAMLIYGELGGLDRAAETDLMQLMRVTGTLAGERDWYDLAVQLDQAGYPAEAKAVLDEGAGKKFVDLQKPAFSQLAERLSSRIAADAASPAPSEAAALASGRGMDALRAGDLFLSRRDFGAAARLYRAALGKSGVDADLVNYRLGTALAQSGNRAEAEAAFAKVRGPRAGLVKFWKVWLGRGS